MLFWWIWFVCYNVCGSFLYIFESDVYIYDCFDWIYFGILCFVERIGRNGFVDIMEFFVFIIVKISDVLKKMCLD